MWDENPIHLDFDDSNLEEMGSPFFLKISGASKENIQKIATMLDLQLHQAESSDLLVLSIDGSEFGSDKRQAVQLFAAAVAIHYHFPNIKMALHGRDELSPVAPLQVSAAGQLYLSHAGFRLSVEGNARIFTAVELETLREQFHGFASKQKKRSA